MNKPKERKWRVTFKERALKERIGAVMRECLKETLHNGRLNEIDKEIEQL